MASRKRAAVGPFARSSGWIETEAVAIVGVFRGASTLGGDGRHVRVCSRVPVPQLREWLGELGIGASRAKPIRQVMALLRQVLGNSTSQNWDAGCVRD